MLAVIAPDVHDRSSLVIDASNGITVFIEVGMSFSISFVCEHALSYE